MATEIAFGEYLFVSANNKGKIDPVAMLLASREEQKSESSQANKGSGICYNYIHDIESVWWIMVWALFLLCFFDHVLPPIQKVIDIERICDRLKRRFVFKELRKGRYGWIDLNKTKKRSKNNATILKGPMTDVLNAMIDGPSDISSELSTSILELETDGGRLDLSEYFQIDGALLLSDATEKDKSRRYWYDVAIPISFSKDSTESTPDVS